MILYGIISFPKKHCQKCNLFLKTFFRFTTCRRSCEMPEMPSTRLDTTPKSSLPPLLTFFFTLCHCSGYFTLLFPGISCADPFIDEALMVPASQSPHPLPCFTAFNLSTDSNIFLGNGEACSSHPQIVIWIYSSICQTQPNFYKLEG